MKYFININDVPTYEPPGHSNTVNRRLIGPKVQGSEDVEFIIGIIEPPGQADEHKHEDCEQVIYILEGKAEVTVNGEYSEVGPETAIYIPKNALHWVKPMGNDPLKLVVIYAPPKQK